MATPAQAQLAAALAAADPAAAAVARANIAREEQAAQLAMEERSTVKILVDRAIDSRRPAKIARGLVERPRWTVAQLRDSADADVAVDVSVSEDGYLRGTAEEHETISMPFRTFLAQLTDDWRRQPSALRYHLAQTSLEQLPTLRADVNVPPALRVRGVRHVNLWLAIGAHTSGLHYDCFDNLLVVVRGSKRLLLLPPAATSALRPRAAHGASANHSTLSAAELAEALRSDSKLEAMAVRLELSAGEAAFIPEGWWHEVVSPEEATLAINWWWPGPLAGAGEVDGGAAFALRRSYDALVQQEERTLLRELAGCEAADDAPCGCACSNEQYYNARYDVADAVLNKLGGGTRTCLAYILVTDPAELLRDFAAAAAERPADLARRLTGASPPVARALQLQFERALQSSCAASAERAAERMENTFAVLGDDAPEIRRKLVAASARVTEEAARRVLHRVLGLGEGLLTPPAKLSVAVGGGKRRRDD